MMKKKPENCNTIYTFSWLFVNHSSFVCGNNCYWILSTRLDTEKPNQQSTKTDTESIAFNYYYCFVSFAHSQSTTFCMRIYFRGKCMHVSRSLLNEVCCDFVCAWLLFRPMIITSVHISHTKQIQIHTEHTLIPYTLRHEN